MTKLKSIIQKLNELRDSIPTPQVERQIRNWFKRKVDETKPDDIQFTIFDGASKIRVHIHYTIVPLYLLGKNGLDIDRRKFTEEILSSSGWYVALAWKSNYGKSHALTLERDKGEQVEKPRYLYHFTYTDAINSILKRGLIPDYSHGTFRSIEPRVYFFLDYTPVSAEMLGFEENAVFRLDTRKFSKFNIYDDERISTGNAVWTPSHIPGRALELVAQGTTDDLPDRI